MSFMRRPEKAYVQAVGEDKFESFLSNLGVLEDIKEKKRKCKFCSETVTIESIAYVFPDGGSIKFVCDKPKCMSALLEYINEGKEL